MPRKARPTTRKRRQRVPLDLPAHHIAVFWFSAQIATARANAIQAWLRVRGITPVFFLSTSKDERVIVIVGFEHAKDAEALADDLGGVVEEEA